MLWVGLGYLLVFVKFTLPSIAELHLPQDLVPTGRTIFIVALDVSWCWHLESLLRYPSLLLPPSPPALPETYAENHECTSYNADSS